MNRLAREVPIILSLVLLGMWLLLSDELSAAQFALGALLSLTLVLAIAGLRPVRPQLRRLYLVIPLAATVVVDILKSNLHVAAVVLGQLRNVPVRSGFLEIPLQLKDPHGLAVLAIIVTSTPGTSWAGVSPDGGTLTLHVLDLKDEQGLIHAIKQRYEQPLIGMFE